MNIDNVQVLYYEHLDFTLNVDNNNSFILQLENDNSIYNLPWGNYTFIKVKYTNGYKFYVLQERGNNNSFVYYSNELMYISHSEYNTFNTTNIEFEEDVNYGIYNGNVYILEKIDWTFKFKSW